MAGTKEKQKARKNAAACCSRAFSVIYSDPDKWYDENSIIGGWITGNKAGRLFRSTKQDRREPGRPAAALNRKMKKAAWVFSALDGNRSNTRTARGSMESRRIFRVVLTCLVLAVCVGLCFAAAAAAEPSADSGIPVLSITMDPEEYQKVIKSPDHSYRAQEGSVRIDLPAGYQSPYGEIDMEYIGVDLPLDYFRGRGNSTWLQEKKPFKIKLDGKADLLGMGKSKHWLLIANALDPSLLRNRIMLDTGRRFGLAYTPGILSVDLYINGEYMGNYMLSQQVRVGKASVGIEEIVPEASTEPEITGGYLLAMNPGSGEPQENIFITERGVRFLLKTPSFDGEEDEAGAQEQRNYITEYLQRTENAVFGEERKDPDGVSWTEYMDPESAAKYWWMQELCLNGDAFRSDSTFLYKDRGEKLYWGPLWDFDITLNPVDYTDSLNGISMAWLDHLRACDPQFQEILLRTWTEMDPILEELVRDGGVIDTFAAEIRPSWLRDRERWDPSGEAGETALDTQVIELKHFISQRRKAINAGLEQLGEVTEQSSRAQEQNDSAESANQAVPGAQPDDLAGGISGTCYWRIDAQGHLEIGPLDGKEGTLGTWANESQRPWHPYTADIRSASFKGTVHAQTCLTMFYHCYDLEKIDLAGLDTSGVTMMRGMFAWCWNLKELDVSALDTSSAANMREMFLACDSLTSLDLSAFRFTGVTDMRCMFYRCHHLKSITLPQNGASAVTNLCGMFANCYSLESLDLSGLDTSHATCMRALFFRCHSLTEINFTGADTSNVTDMDSMFAECGSLTTLDLTGFDTSHVTDMGCMFLACGSLAELDLTSFDTAAADMDYLFANCPALRSVAVGEKWTSEPGRGEETMFHGCSLPAEEMIR